MTSEQEAKCHAIIHSHAVACGAGNAVPIVGLGIAVDVVTMTTMACALAAVFGTDNLPSEVAKGIAIGAIKKQFLKQPIKTIGKELVKLIPVPGLNSAVAAAVSAGFLESAGWVMAKDLEARAK